MYKVTRYLLSPSYLAIKGVVSYGTDDETSCCGKTSFLFVISNRIVLLWMNNRITNLITSRRR